jgi:hypothetical protein
MTRGCFYALHLVLDAQLAPLEVGYFTVVGGGGRENGLELLLQSTVLLFKRCDMSLDGHVACSFLSHLPRHSLMPRLQVYEGSVTRSAGFVEGEIMV